LWHTRRISFLATFLFASSSWFLHTSRLASTDLAYVLPVTFLLGAIWLHSERHTSIATALTLFSAISLFYVPGMIWFVVPGIIWQRRILIKTLRRLSVRWQAGSIVLLLAGLMPLILAL